MPRILQVAIALSIALSNAACGWSARLAWGQITLREHPGGVAVMLGDALFTDYLTGGEQPNEVGRQPVLWPVIGPSGAAMTRSYPVGKLLPDERRDHPHHRSLWFAHGDVNGHDFWHGTTRPRAKTKNKALAIKHRQFAQLTSGDVATLVTHNDWMVGPQRLLSDARMLTFGVRNLGTDAEWRWIDFKIKLIASEQTITLGDTKEGTFALRVPGTMKVDAQQGGRIVNSRGQPNAAAWGMPARWVDYHGPIDGQTLGIAMFCHPTNARHPCRWQVRNYGLFAANPFGEVPFPPADRKQGKLTIPAGEHLTLRYRVLLHRGDQQQAELEDRFAEFASLP